jgi:hypothetical protein
VENSAKKKMKYNKNRLNVDFSADFIPISVKSVATLFIHFAQ